MLLFLLSLACSTVWSASAANCSDPDVKFHTCCLQIGVNIQWPQDARSIFDRACQYPPMSLDATEHSQLGRYMAEYAACYADGQDNVERCAKEGVPNDVRALFFLHADCQDYCRGSGTTQLEYKYAHVECRDELVRHQTGKANRKSVDLESDTAMQRLGRCKGILCDRPLQWKELC